jgi:hypothetical protein
MEQTRLRPKNDAEKPAVQSEVDIEHAPVVNDPRKWSSMKKVNLANFTASEI